MNRIGRILCHGITLITSLLLMVSCHRHSDPSENRITPVDTTTAYSGAFTTFSVSSTIDDTSLRAIAGINVSPSADGKVISKMIHDNNDIKVFCVINSPTLNKPTYVTLTWRKINGENKYFHNHEDASFTLNATEQEMLNNDWYIIGVIGGTNKDGTDIPNPAQRYVYMTQKESITPQNMGDNIVYNVPFAFPWTKLDVIPNVEIGPPGHNPDKIALRVPNKVVFKAQGVLLKHTIENHMFNTWDVEKVTIQSNAFDQVGCFNFDNVSTAPSGGIYPRWMSERHDNQYELDGNGTLTRYHDFTFAEKFQMGPAIGLGRGENNYKAYKNDKYFVTWGIKPTSQYIAYDMGQPNNLEKTLKRDAPEANTITRVYYQIVPVKSDATRFEEGIANRQRQERVGTTVKNRALSLMNYYSNIPIDNGKSYYVQSAIVRPQMPLDLLAPTYQASLGSDAIVEQDPTRDPFINGTKYYYKLSDQGIKTGGDATHPLAVFGKFEGVPSEYHIPTSDEVKGILGLATTSGIRTNYTATTSAESESRYNSGTTYQETFMLPSSGAVNKTKRLFNNMTVYDPTRDMDPDPTRTEIHAYAIRFMGATRAGDPSLHTERNLYRTAYRYKFYRKPIGTQEQNYMVVDAIYLGPTSTVTIHDVANPDWWKSNFDNGTGTTSESNQRNHITRSFPATGYEYNGQVYNYGVVGVILLADSYRADQKTSIAYYRPSKLGVATDTRISLGTLYRTYPTGFGQLPVESYPNNNNIFDQEKIALPVRLMRDTQINRRVLSRAYPGATDTSR